MNLKISQYEPMTVTEYDMPENGFSPSILNFKNEAYGICDGWVISHNILEKTSTKILQVGNLDYTDWCLAPNGNLLGLACSDNKNAICEIDLNTLDINYYGPIIMANDYRGLIIGSNDKIYAIPANATTAMSIDVYDRVVQRFGDLGDGCKWWGGVLGKDLKIYCAPYDSDLILVINTEDDTVETFGSLAGGILGKYCGLVIDHVGLLYGVPYNATQVLEIDTDNRTHRFIGVEIAGDNKFRGGTFTPAKKIYCAPFDHRQILEIDTVDKNVSLFHDFEGSSKFNGIIYTRDSLIHLLKKDYSKMVELDLKLVVTPAISMLCSPFIKNNLGGI